MHAQDIRTNLANLCIEMWKGTFQAFLNHWKPQWILMDRSTTLSDQESTAVHKSMLCNAIHSNPEFLQIEHLDKVGQAQGTSKITYHNYITLVHTTAFQLNLKCPKCSTHHTEVNSTNSTPNNTKSSSCGGLGHSWHNKWVG